MPHGTGGLAAGGGPEGKCPEVAANPQPGAGAGAMLLTDSIPPVPLWEGSCDVEGMGPEVRKSGKPSPSRLPGPSAVGTVFSVAGGTPVVLA
mmetsp:Transcript_134996/g.320038  ORF Transcript_134996/g.320038 Transcript_134996/m.320038 type:complete len:92 (+) Transcript_134996:1801-2076(+)